jgi:hypothetical protein
VCFINPSPSFYKHWKHTKNKTMRHTGKFERTTAVKNAKEVDEQAEEKQAKAQVLKFNKNLQFQQDYNLYAAKFGSNVSKFLIHLINQEKLFENKTHHGMFYCLMNTITVHTGLTRNEQRTCKDKLVEMGIIHTEMIWKGRNSFEFYKIFWKPLGELLTSEKPMTFKPLKNAVIGKTDGGSSEKPMSYIDIFKNIFFIEKAPGGRSIKIKQPKKELFHPTYKWLVDYCTKNNKFIYVGKFYHQYKEPRGFSSEEECMRKIEVWFADPRNHARNIDGKPAVVYDRTISISPEEKKEQEEKAKKYKDKINQQAEERQARRQAEEKRIKQTDYSKYSCPSNYTFGVDNGKHPECDDCLVYDQCLEKKEQNKLLQHK